MGKYFDAYDEFSDCPVITENNRDDLADRLSEMEDLINLFEEIERRLDSLGCSDIDQVKSEAEKLEDALADYDYKEGLRFQKEMERWIG